MSPEQAPPSHYGGAPLRFRLPAGTRLVRIHSAGFGATDFNPTVARSDLSGGRFDSTPADPYPFLYAALDEHTAVSETLLRDVPFDRRGARALPRIRLTGLRIDWVRTTADLDLVDLRSGRALAAVGQDAWLTTAPAARYALTRRWAVAIRAWAAWSAGLIWRSGREPDGISLVLFGDRTPDGSLEAANIEAPLPPDSRDLRSGAGERYVEQLLTDYSVALM